MIQMTMTATMMTTVMTMKKIVMVQQVTRMVTQSRTMIKVGKMTNIYMMLTVQNAQIFMIINISLYDNHRIIII